MMRLVSILFRQNSGIGSLRRFSDKQKFSSNFNPTAPDFSGWNCTPNNMILFHDSRKSAAIFTLSNRVGE